MNKYIIKNCPCNVTTEDMCDWENTNETYCKDCTDCKLKQIVELCKENLNSLETYVDVRSLECVMLQDILQLLQIEEVE